MGDGRIVCLDVSPHCKGNIEYFKCLGKILDNSNTPGIFMNYLFTKARPFILGTTKHS